jgi:hypothetical protein
MSNKSNITLGAYGSGSLPVITGFTTLTGWQSSGNGVQSVVVSSMNKPTTYPVPGNKAITPLNLLSINSIPQVLGRTPNLTDTNGGYRYYNHVAGTVNGVDTTKLDGTIAAGSLTGLKEVVFRTSEWNLYRGRIVSQVGGLLTFDLFYYIGNGVSPRIDAVNMAKSPWGYFYQNDSSYLDQFGEWHYDYPTKRLRVFFGANNPASYTVQVPLADTLISITSGTGLVIRDLRLVGSNLYGVLGSAVAVTIEGCVIDQMGGQAIGIYRPYNTFIRNNTLSNCMQTGIYTRVANSDVIYNNLNINSNTIKNIGIFPGMGSLNQGGVDYTGVSATTYQDTNIDSNYVSKTGGDGIAWQGSNVSVGFNRVDSFCSVLQDHAGIYTYQTPGTVNTFTNRRIHHNFVNNSTGSPGGTPLSRLANCPATNPACFKRFVRVNGIYTDGTSDNILIDSNVVWNIKRAGFYHNAPTNVRIYDNFCMGDTGTTNTTNQFANDRATNDDRNPNIGISISDGTTSGGCNDTASNVTITRNTVYMFIPTQSTYLFRNVALAPSCPRTSWLPDNPSGRRRWIKNVGRIDSNYINNTTTASIRLVTLANIQDSLTLADIRTNSQQDVNTTALPNVTKSNAAFFPNPSKDSLPIYLPARYLDVKGIVKERLIKIAPFSYYFGTYVGPLTDSIPPTPPTPPSGQFVVTSDWDTTADITQGGLYNLNSVCTIDGGALSQNASYSVPRSLMFRLRMDDPTCVSSKRSQIHIPSSTAFLDTLEKYQFSLYYPTSFISDSREESHFTLHFGALTNTPTVELLVVNDKIYLRHTFNSACSTPTIRTFLLANVVRNQWVTWTFEFVRSATSTGKIAVYKNKTKMIERFGANVNGNSCSTGTRPIPALGIVKPAWTTTGRYVPSQRIFYLDAVKMAGPSTSITTMLNQVK